jgi:dGTPase
MAVESAQLKHFLSRNLYRHPQVQDNTDRAREVVRGLFERYMAQPRDLPESAPRLPGLEAEHPQHARAVADYIAGMTDRFALREHERLTGERLFD